METMKRNTIRRGAAILGCAASLAGTTVALAPGIATAAPAAKSCGAKVISAPVNGKAGQVAASRIRAEGGATCAEAYAVIRGVVTKKLPRGWTVAHGNFKVPKGLVPQVAVNGKKKVTFALPGNGS
jgi:hypothetical protein